MGVSTCVCRGPQVHPRFDDPLGLMTIIYYRTRQKPKEKGPGWAKSGDPGWAAGTSALGRPGQDGAVTGGWTELWGPGEGDVTSRASAWPSSRPRLFSFGLLGPRRPGARLSALRHNLSRPQSTLSTWPPGRGTPADSGLGLEVCDTGPHVRGLRSPSLPLRQDVIRQLLSTASTRAWARTQPGLTAPTWATSGQASVSPSLKWAVMAQSLALTCTIRPLPLPPEGGLLPHFSGCLRAMFCVQGEGDKYRLATAPFWLFDGPQPSTGCLRGTPPACPPCLIDAVTGLSTGREGLPGCQRGARRRGRHCHCSAKAGGGTGAWTVHSAAPSGLPQSQETKL